MPLLADRVQETTTTGGTGTLTLGGAVTGYRTFAASFSVGNVLFYTIDNGAGEWEIGIGTLVTSGTLSRDTVIESSNSNALVNFSSGTKRVFCSAPTQVLLPNQTSNSGKVLTTDGSNPSWTSTLNSMTIGNLTPGSGAFTTLSASSTVSGTGFSTYLASPPAIGGTTPAAGNFTTLGTTGNVTLGDASGDTVTFNAATVTLNNSTTISAASTKTLTLNGGAGSNGLVLDASNNVGIGTGSPIAKLTVDGGAHIRNYTAPNTSYQSLVLGITGGEAYIQPYTTGLAQIPMNLEGSTIKLNTGGSTKATLDSSGNLGLGVVPSGWGSGHRALDIGVNSYVSGSTSMTIENNAYYNGTNNIYKNSAAATQYQQTNTGTHTWSYAASGTAGNAITFTQAMTLDASGNLGIGTTSASSIAKLTVSNTATTDNNRLGVAASTYLSGPTYAATFLQQADASTTGTTCGLPNSYLGGIYFQNTSYGLIYTNGGAPIVFGTSGAERARIDSSGNFLVGTTSALGAAAGGQIQAIGSSTARGYFIGGRTTGGTTGTCASFQGYNATTFAAGIDIYSDGATNSGAVQVYTNNAGTAVAGPYVSKGGTSWTTASDERLKTDLKPIENAAQKVSTIRAVTGRFKSDEESVSRTFIIAQDIQKVLPEAVNKTKDGFLGVSYTETIPLLVAAIKELTVELNELKNRIN